MKLSTPVLSIAGLLAAHNVAAGKYDPAVAFGTFSTKGCDSGQVDYHAADGVCKSLPGDGLRLWWKQPGCESS